MSGSRIERCWLTYHFTMTFELAVLVNNTKNSSLKIDESLKDTRLLLNCGAT